MSDVAGYYQPQRGVDLRPGAEPGTIDLHCDCGAVSNVTFELEGGTVVARQELAISCPGCGSAHWLTIVPPPDLG